MNDKLAAQLRAYRLQHLYALRTMDYRCLLAVQYSRDAIYWMDYCRYSEN